MGAALFFGSFGDEAAQIVFALRLADGSSAAAVQVSALLAAGLIGGIVAGALAPRAVVLLGTRRLIALVFFAEAGLIACASFANTLPWYLGISAALGCLGSVLWSAVMIALPALDLPGASIEIGNRVVQTVRNLGYVVGPLLGSALFAWSSGVQGLLVLALAMLAAAIGAALILPSLMGSSVGKVSSPNTRKSADVVGLLQTQGVLRALMPLIVTVLVTSALNVLLIVRIRSELGYSAGVYGIVVAALSVGLVAGPALFAGFAGRLGPAAGASVAAASIGLGVIAIGTANTPWQLGLAAALIGIANGVQNTLMSTFIMQRVDAEHRPFRMPAYVLILQCTVFAGFIGAAFIDVAAAGSALVAAGVTAIIVVLIKA
ncbi:MFS transporter [Arthrobacter sp. TMN-49]